MSRASPSGTAPAPLLGMTTTFLAFVLGALVTSIWFLRARAAALPVAPSARLDAWLPDAPFRDTIVVSLRPRPRA